jgi:type II secretory pathway component PulK
MFVRPRQSEEGTILIIAILIVSLILVIASDARYVARVEWEAASNADVDFQLEQALKAGYQVAETYLRQDLVDSPDVDHLYEEWASNEGIEKELDPGQYGFRISTPPRPDGTSPFPSIRIFIEDEERKYPLPLLTKGADTMKERRRDSLTNLIRLYRANTRYEVDANTARAMAEQIIAFVTREERDASFGPTPRPGTKSGMPFRPVDLALIPNIPEFLIYDTVDEDGVLARGLIHFVTTWTDLVVNVNTAGDAVLQAVMRPEDSSVGHDIFAERGTKGEDYLEYDTEMRERYGDDYRRNPDAQQRADAEEDEEESAGYWEDLEKIKEDVDTFTDRVLSDVRLYLTTKSKVFSIWVETELNGIKARRRWVVRREGARLLPVISERVDFPYLRKLTQEEQGRRDSFR